MPQPKVWLQGFVEVLLGGSWKLQGTIHMFAEDGVTPLATGSIDLSAGKAYALVVQ
jgi:hypothetical protein